MVDRRTRPGNGQQLKLHAHAAGDGAAQMPAGAGEEPTGRCWLLAGGRWSRVNYPVDSDQENEKATAAAGFQRIGAFGDVIHRVSGEVYIRGGHEFMLQVCLFDEIVVLLAQSAPDFIDVLLTATTLATQMATLQEIEFRLEDERRARREKEEKRKGR
jgi:hypothetical protein